MKAYYLLICCLFLSSCGVKNPLGLEYQAHYMEIYPKKSEIFASPSFLTIDFAFHTYTYSGPTNYSLIGHWYFSGDTLVLSPQYQLTMDPKNDSISADYLRTVKKRNSVITAKPMKCVFGGENLYILPNDEPFIIEDGSSEILTFPPHWHSHTSSEPRKFVIWRKTTRGNPFKYFKHTKAAFFTN